MYQKQMWCSGLIRSTHYCHTWDKLTVDMDQSLVIQGKCYCLSRKKTHTDTHSYMNPQMCISLDTIPVTQKNLCSNFFHWDVETKQLNRPWCNNHQSLCPLMQSIRQCNGLVRVSSHINPHIKLMDKGVCQPAHGICIDPLELGVGHPTWPRLWLCLLLFQSPLSSTAHSNCILWGFKSRVHVGILCCIRRLLCKSMLCMVKLVLQCIDGFWYCQQKIG